MSTPLRRASIRVAVGIVCALGLMLPGSLAHADWDQTYESGSASDHSEFTEVVVTSSGGALLSGFYRGSFEGLTTGSGYRHFVQYRNSAGNVQWTQDANLGAACPEPIYFDSDRSGGMGEEAYFLVTDCAGHHVVSADATGVVASRRVDVDVPPPPGGSVPGVPCCVEGYASFAADPTGGVHVVARSKVFEAGNSSTWKLFQLDRMLAVESSTPLPANLYEVVENGYQDTNQSIDNLVAPDGSGWVVGFVAGSTTANSALTLIKVDPAGVGTTTTSLPGYGCYEPGDGERPFVEALQTVGSELWVFACDKIPPTPGPGYTMTGTILVLDASTGSLLGSVPPPPGIDAEVREFGAPQMTWSTDGSLVQTSSHTGVILWRRDGVREDSTWDAIGLSGAPSGSNVRIASADRLDDDYIVAVGSLADPAFIDPVRDDGPRRAVIERRELPTLTGITPARLLETRPGQSTIDGVSAGIGRRAADSTTPVAIHGRADVPSTASSIVVNVTAIGPDDRGYITIFPCGADRPVTASLNFDVGVTTGNTVTSQVGATGDICVYTSVATHVAVDVNAFFRPTPSFGPMVPARLTDTRSGLPTADGQEAGTGRIAAGETRAVDVRGRGGVDAAAEEIVANVTAINPSSTGFATVFPCGQTQPATSSLNFGPGQTVGNQAIVDIGAGGDVCIYSSAAIDLVVDATAWLGADSGQSDSAPVRLVDTRPTGSTFDGAWAGGGAIPTGQTAEFRATSRGNSAADSVGPTRHAVFNVTVVNPTADGFITMWPCRSGEPGQPTASSLNYIAGVNAGNVAVTPVYDGDGVMCVYTSATTDIVVDLLSYR